MTAEEKFAEEKFQVARRVVIAEQQYITYTEFLPAVGLALPAYPGYDPRVNASLGNEFAAAGYRMRSMTHATLGSRPTRTATPRRSWTTSRRPGGAGHRRRAAVPQRRADRQPAAQRAVPGVASRQ